MTRRIGDGFAVIAVVSIFVLIAGLVGALVSGVWAEYVFGMTDPPLITRIGVVAAATAVCTLLVSLLGMAAFHD